jgi:hypothetical protein
MERWTNEEIEILKSLNELKLTKEEINEKLPNRSHNSIVKKARKLNIKWLTKQINNRSWSKEEEEILKEHYKDPNITKLIGRTDMAIQQKLNKMGVILKNRPWSKNDIEYLKEKYYDEEITILETKLNRTWNSIKLKAIKLNLKRSNDFIRKSNMINFLDGTNKSYYWLGFLLADGHFDFKNKRIILKLSDKDITHIKEYAKFINTPNITHNVTENYVSVSVQNVQIFNLITDFIKLTEQHKTIKPNDLSILEYTKEQMLSLIIGFIDGDGCILKQTGREDCLLQIHVHKNWFDNIRFIEEFIYSYFGEPKNKTLTRIGNDGYTRLIITNNKILKKLKNELLTLDLTYLIRKWDLIDENYISNKDQIKIDRDTIKNLYLSGLKSIEIIKTNKFTKSLVYSTIKLLNLT